jgi:hypothetical protein
VGRDRSLAGSWNALPHALVTLGGVGIAWQAIEGHLRWTMKCVWCKQAITFTDMRIECPRASKLFGRSKPHKSDNRHTPTGDPCECGRPADDHRVSHQPKGDPCECGLPASAHVWRQKLALGNVIVALAKRDGWTCQLCGKPFPTPHPPHPNPLSIEVDHSVPRWKSNCDELANLQLAHRQCNVKKGSGDEKSPRQQVQHARAQFRNIVLIAAATDARWLLERLAPALAGLNRLFIDLGRASEALTIVETAVAGFRHLYSTRGDPYLPHLAVCQTKNAEILLWLGRNDESRLAAKAADEALARIYSATVANRCRDK